MTLKDLNLALNELNEKTWNFFLQEQPQLEPFQVIKILIPFLNQNPEKFSPFLMKLWNIYAKEDSHQTVLWVLFQEIKDINCGWFSEFLLEIIPINTEFIKEEIFNLIPLNPFLTISLDSKLIKKLIKVDVPDFQFFLYKFLLYENLLSEIPPKMLLKFNKLPKNLQLEFVHLLFEFNSIFVIEFIKNELLTDNNILHSQVRLSIILNCLNDLKTYYSEPEDLIKFLMHEDDSFFNESIILELIQPEILKKAFIQEIVNFYLNHNKVRLRIFLLQHTSQYIHIYSKKMQKMFFPLINDTSIEVRISLINLISPLWINENFIEKILLDSDIIIVKALVINITPIFLKLSLDLRTNILNTISNHSQLSYLREFIIGYNYLKNFSYLAEVNKYFVEPVKYDINFIYIIAGMVESSWNNLPKRIKTFLLKNALILPLSLNIMLKEILNRQRNLDIDAQNYLLQIKESSDFIELDSIDN